MANNIAIYREADLHEVVALNRQMIDLMENLFVSLSEGRVVMPPILSLDLHDKNAEVDVKTAYVPGLDGFAVKISPGFFNNPQLGLASVNGLMVYFSAETGMVKAVFLDNGFLTDIRTAAAGGLATRHLAPSKVDTAGIIGTGVQARLQAKAAFLERPFSQLMIHGRTPAHAEACAEDLSHYFGTLGVKVAVTIAEDCKKMVQESQLVITTTPARSALITADCLHPNLHITAMGSDAPGKRELDQNVLEQADQYYCDSLNQTEILGELQGMAKADLTAPPIELGVMIRDELGRKNDQQMTIADLTGTGAQDTAIANFAFHELTKTAHGTLVEN